MAKNVTILVAEDNSGDVFLIKKILSKLFAKKTITVVANGEEALNYLYNSTKTGEEHTKPAFVILDLNLPKIDGKEILTQIKKHDQLKSIPVIMFSSSQSPKDIRAAYELHVNCYIVKPYDLEEYTQVLETACDFWTNTVSLPNFETH